MALPDDRLQNILAHKDVDNSLYGESWAICDGAIVIYDGDDPPSWFPQERDENGNTAQFGEASARK